MFTICVEHKFVKSIVFVTMHSVDFLMMSPLLQNDGDSCSVISLLFTMNIVSEVIQKNKLP